MVLQAGEGSAKCLALAVKTKSQALLLGRGELPLEILPPLAAFFDPISRLCVQMAPSLCFRPQLSHQDCGPSPSTSVLLQTCPPALQVVSSHHYPWHCSRPRSRAGILKPDCSGLNPASVVLGYLTVVNLLSCSSTQFPVL